MKITERDNVAVALEPLKAGELVLSGSIIAAVDVQKGDYFRCDYGSLGYVSVHFV